MLPSRSRSEGVGPPRFEFDWEQDLFILATRLWARLNEWRRRGAPVSTAAALEVGLPTYEGLAQIISGHPVRLVAARGLGGLRGYELLYPEHMAIFGQVQHNELLLKLRVMLDAATLKVIEDELGWSKAVDAALETRLALLARARELLLEDWAGAGELFEQVAPLVLDRLELQRPGARVVEALWRRAQLGPELYDVPSADKLPWELLWGRVLARPDLSQPLGAVPDDASRDGFDAQDITTEHEAPAAPESLKIVGIDEREAQELPSHIFEKVETAEQYLGQQRSPDGEDELDEHLDALDALELDTLYRGSRPASSLYKAEICIDALIPDVSHVQPHERAILYHEWDFKAQRFKDDWVAVYPTTLPPLHDPWAQLNKPFVQAQISQLIRALIRHRQLLRPKPKQVDGEELDLDMIVDHLVARAAGAPGHSRLYVQPSRQLRSLSMTLLIDLSLSSDSFVKEQRVLEVSKQAALILGEVCDVLGDELQILGFASQTRHVVRVFTIKDWSESWGGAQGRLGALRPQGYTRIGPPIRHAVKQLSGRASARKALLLLSDGKPTDFDRYEGRYGVEDVRQAVREAERAQVHVHGFTIDERARPYLTPMLGDGGWSVISEVSELITAMIKYYSRMMG